MIGLFWAFVWCVVTGVFAWGLVRSLRRPRAHECHACGYDLRATPVVRVACTECGAPRDRRTRTEHAWEFRSAMWFMSLMIWVFITCIWSAGL